MNKKLKIFIAYFPVFLIAGQIATNLLYFIAPSAYYAAGFYLNMAFGTNLFFAVFLIGITQWFRFCAISRYAAFAQLSFAIFYILIKEDNIYNIMFQIVVGSFALALTFRYFVIKFPLCKVSLVISFFKSVLKTGSCEKGLDRWQRITYHKIAKQHGNGI